MKIKDGFEVMNIAGDYMLIPLGDNMTTFNGTVALNDVSAYILEILQKPCTIDDLVNAVLKEYDIDRATAESDIIETIAEMKKIGIVEE